MALRIEVQPDGTIELMRPRNGHTQFLYYDRLESALIVIRYWIRRDLEAASKDRFVSQAKTEARKAFKQLMEKANAEFKARTAGSARR